MLEKLGFTEKKYSWTSFDFSIKKIFYKNVAILLALFIASIFVMTVNNWSSGIVVFIVFLIFLIFTIYQYLFFAYGKFDFAVGKCVAVDKAINTIFKNKVYGRCSLTILSDDGKYYIVPIKPTDEIEKGSKIIVYMSMSSKTEENTNTYRINNPIAYTVLEHSRQSA